MEIKIKKLFEDAELPYQATDGSANFDFFLHRIERKGINKYILYLGLAVEIPEGYKMVLVPRSSITGTDVLMQNSPGQIDSDYRGEIQMRVTLLPVGVTTGRKLPREFFTSWFAENHEYVLCYPELPWKVGERVAQGYIEQKIAIDFLQVEQLNETSRGSGGFGSTGTKGAVDTTTKRVCEKYGDTDYNLLRDQSQRV